MKDLLIREDPLITGLFILFSASFLIEMFFYIYFFSKAGKVKKKNQFRKKTAVPVSVIICARNEEENLIKNLPRILDQEYPDFEVVVVDDCSDDRTQEILRDFKLRYAHLKITSINNNPKFTHSKKLALTIGIKAAKNEHLLLTDADCYPVSRKWIREIMLSYKTNTEIVLAYGGYLPTPGFLNKLIRYETLFTAMQYMGFAERGMPYMGVGRNLSYKKSLFFRNKGFASHYHLASGDDDLFISETANRINTLVATGFDTFTLSIPETRLSDWYRQRKRHFLTGFRYKFSIKALLGLEYFSRMVFHISFILLLIQYQFSLLILSVYLLNLIVKGIIFKIVSNRLNEKFLFIFSLIIDPFIPFIYFIIHLFNYLERKNNRWK